MFYREIWLIFRNFIEIIIKNNVLIMVLKINGVKLYWINCIYIRNIKFVWYLMWIIKWYLMIMYEYLNIFFIYILIDILLCYMVMKYDFKDLILW